MGHTAEQSAGSGSMPRVHHRCPHSLGSLYLNSARERTQYVKQILIQLEGIQIASFFRLEKYWLAVLLEMSAYFYWYHNKLLISKHSAFRHSNLLNLESRQGLKHIQCLSQVKQWAYQTFNTSKGYKRQISRRAFLWVNLG